MAVKMPTSVTPTPPTDQAMEMMARANGQKNNTVASPRMPNTPPLYNPDSRTISLVNTPSTTDSRIDDSIVSLRSTWSSAKIQYYAQASEEALIEQYVSNYGELYFCEYDESAYNDWTDIIQDAVVTLNLGKPFFVAWSDTRICQVIGADTESEPRMTVLIDGSSYAMSDVGIAEVPIYNIVMQYQDRNAFPTTGSKDRLYIDTNEKTMYYWDGVQYETISRAQSMHKLTFGADQEYVYDGSEDVTVPVYMGTTG